MSKESKGLRGFANPENRKHINLGGRPVGSKNLNTLKRAKLNLDANAESATEFLAALMNNDKSFLELDSDVPLTLRHKAAIAIIDKSISNAKDNEKVQRAIDKEEADNDKTIPLVPTDEDGTTVFSATASDD